MTFTKKYRNYTITDDCKKDAGGWYPCCIVQNNDTGEGQSISMALIVGSHNEALRAAVLNAMRLIRNDEIGY